MSAPDARKAPSVALFFTFGVSLIDWDHLGYLEREIQLYQDLAERGIKTTFITYGNDLDLGYESRLDPIKIVPLNTSRFMPYSRVMKYLRSLSLPATLQKTLTSVNLIKTNQLWGSWSAVKAARVFQKPLLLRCGYEPNLLAARQGRSWLYRKIVRMVSRKSYQAADRILLACEEDSAFVQQEFNISRDKISVRMNFVDTDLFAPQDRQKLEKSILYIGRLAAEKNLAMLLEALQGSDYMLTLVGTGEEQPALKKYASQNNIKVDFLGAVPNDKLPGLINRHALFVLCSRYEGNPKALLEAMACGAAVVGSNVIGINNVIRHGVTGWLCEPDAEALRVGIDHLMESSSVRETLGNNARKYILENASLASYAEAEAKTYSELLSTIIG